MKICTKFNYEKLKSEIVSNIRYSECESFPLIIHRYGSYLLVIKYLENHKYLYLCTNELMDKNVGILNEWTKHRVINMLGDACYILDIFYPPMFCDDYINMYNEFVDKYINCIKKEVEV